MDYLLMTSLIRACGRLGLGAGRSFGAFGGRPSLDCVLPSFTCESLALLDDKEGGSGNLRISLVSLAQPAARSSGLYKHV